MTTIEKIQNLDAIEQLRDAWHRLRGTSEFETLSFDQYADTVSSDEQVMSPLVVVVREGGQVSAILPFAVLRQPKKFVVGELRLFSVDHQVLRAVSAMIGELSLTQAKLIVRELTQISFCDAINLYEIPTGNNLYKALHEQSPDLNLSSATRDIFPHWIIDFPETFDDYFATFKSRRRIEMRRNMRRFQEAHQVVFETITEREKIGYFLEKGEAVSRQTYQWDLGTRLVNDEPTRSKLQICARQKEMRCYLVHADGLAIAFAWGHLINNVFHYETPGFLREYSRWSPGTIILMKIIEDLIENTTCRRFDFGMGGDFTGYKSHFGNYYYDAAVVEFYPCKTFKSWFLYRLDRLFGQVKKLLRRLVSPQLKSRAKQILRKFSILK